MKYPGTNLDWFVVGFAIAENSDSVLFIEKQKSWCKGLWNGVGGGVEPFDGLNTTRLFQSKMAMCREFDEETGLLTTVDDWEHFCTLREPKAHVDFFRFFTDHAVLARARKLTQERVGLFHYTLAVTMAAMMPNLCWLVPMARHRKLVHAEVEEQGGQYDGVR